MQAFLKLHRYMKVRKSKQFSKPHQFGFLFSFRNKLVKSAFWTGEGEATGIWQGKGFYSE